MKISLIGFNKVLLVTGFVIPEWLYCFQNVGFYSRWLLRNLYWYSRTFPVSRSTIEMLAPGEWHVQQIAIKTDIVSLSSLLTHCEQVLQVLQYFFRWFWTSQCQLGLNLCLSQKNTSAWFTVFRKPSENMFGNTKIIEACFESKLVQ